MSKLSHAAWSRAPRLAPAEAARVAWSFAAVRYRHLPLFSALAQNAVDNVGGYSLGSLSELAWAYTKLYPSPSSPLLQLLQRVQRVQLDDAARQAGEGGWPLHQSILLGWTAGLEKGLQSHAPQITVIMASSCQRQVRRTA